MQIPNSITYSMTQDEIEYLSEQATNIYNCPRRGRGRPWEECLKMSARGAVLEFALVRQGGIKNPKDFDVRDPDSYAWDIVWDGSKTEVKRKEFINKDTKWYSFNNKHYTQTFLRNLDLIDTFIVGDFVQPEVNVFNVEWMFITRVNSNFNEYVAPSRYNNGQMVYFHKKDPNCEYLLEEKQIQQPSFTV